MKRNRILLLLICFSLIISGLVSCADEEDPDYDPGDIPIIDSVPEDYNLDGQQVGIYYAEHIYEMVLGDEEATDIVYSKIHQRNLTVNARLNCKLNLISAENNGWAEYGGNLQQCVHQMDKSFEISTCTNNSIVSQRLYALFHTMNDASYIDIEADWWYKDTIMELTPDYYYYRFLYGDIFIGGLTFAGAIYYNKDLYSEYVDPGNPDALYTYVLNGTWTFEQFDIECARSAIDLGGENNIYAYMLARSGEPINFFATGCGVEYYTRDSRGMPIITVYNQKSVDFTQKLYNLLYNNKGAFILFPKFGPEVDHATDFQDRKAMFSLGSLGAILSDGMREMEDSYGILPYPKWTPQQEEYINFTNNGSVYVGVTKNVPYDRAMEETSAVIEVMAAEAYRTVKDAFYEQACKRAYSRDDTSAEMLDIITGRHKTIKSRMTKNFIYEYGNQAGTIFMTIMAKGAVGNPNFTSEWEGLEESANTQLSNLITDYLKDSN